MWKTFLLAVDQLSDRRVIGVIVKSLAITLLLCVLIGWGGAQLIQCAFDWFNADARHDTYYVALAGVAQALAVAFIVIIGFRAIAIPVTGFFADDVVAAVEAKHYPAEAERARKVGIGLSLRMGTTSLLRVVGINLLMIPIYLGLMLTAVGPVIAFVIVNALLLGRDLGEMVAVRHLDRPAMRQWLGNTRWDRALLGLVVTGAFMVPLLNFLAPIIGAAMAAHLFHKGRGTV
jgi:CysZ protein